MSAPDKEWNDRMLTQMRLIRECLLESGPDEKITIVEEDNYALMTHRLFILGSFKNHREESKPHSYSFEINFEINTTANAAAEIMRNVMYVISPEEVKIGKTYYFDRESKKMYYGDEASRVSIKQMYKLVGKVECPICEKYYPENYVSERGFCIICEDSGKANIVYN